MTYSKGDRVKHPNREDWGLGEVLEDCRGDHLHVFFVGAGDRTLSLQHIQPVKVEGAEATSSHLDNLSAAGTGKKVQYQTVEECVDRFLAQYPQGFQDEGYSAEERDDKLEAHELAKEVLAEDALDALLAEADFEQVAKAALKVANKTTLVYPNERMALREGLKGPAGAEPFATALRELLYGEGEMESRFAGFAGALEQLGAAKWATATYFLFIRFPEQHIFIKPTVTQQASKSCRFEINYKTALNWLTYNSVQKFAFYLAEQISDLKPVDMIDIQSFMWCISPDRKKA